MHFSLLAWKLVTRAIHNEFLEELLFTAFVDKNDMFPTSMDVNMILKTKGKDKAEHWRYHLKVSTIQQ